jgi:cytochrome c553
MKKIVQLSSLVLAGALIVGCSSNEDKKYVDQQQKIEIKDSSKVIDNIKTDVKEAVNEVQESQVVQEATQTAQEIKEQTESSVKDIQEEIKQATQAVSNEVGKRVQSVEDDIAATASTNSDEGAKLYAKCVSCHGANGEKKALGASQIIKGWSAQEVEESLLGYQAGTYGGKMKTIMVGQVANMTPEQIKVLSEHIASF